MEDLINKMANRESIRVYHEIDENYYSASSNSFIGSIYGLLNFTNIADKADEDGYGYPKLSPEYILQSSLPRYPRAPTITIFLAIAVIVPY